MVNRQSDPLDTVFAALAHPARRRMLEHLTRRAASVGELAEPFRMSAPAISRHVRVLESAGLVVRERDGRLHRIALAGSALARALHWLDRHHRFWSTRLDRLAAILESPATPREDPAWPRPNPAPGSRSSSSARSPRRRSASSTHSRRPPR